MSQCITCKQVTDKYKCPKCLEHYCSVKCFQEHKASPTCEEEYQKNNTPVPDATDAEEPTCHDPFKTEDTVPLHKLELLRHSDELKQLLYNKHLRSFLNEIDVAPNAWKAMRAAMQEPLFIEFADACLKLVEDEQAPDL